MLREEIAYAFSPRKNVMLILPIDFNAVLKRSRHKSYLAIFAFSALSYMTFAMVSNKSAALRNSGA